MNSRMIYNGGYVPEMHIMTDGTFKGWLCYRHPDGQLVTLADLKKHTDLIKATPPPLRPDVIRTIEGMAP